MTGLRRRPLVVAATAATAVFVVVAAWVALSDALPYEARALRAITSSIGPSRDNAMRAAAATAEAWILAPAAGLAFGFLAGRRRWREATLVAGAASVAWVVNPLLKQGFTRDRPSVRPWVAVPSRYAFPSGHAVASMAFAVALTVLAWPTRGRWPVIAGATGYVVVVGTSQLGLGVHRPGDVVAGWALGVATVCGLAAWLWAAPPR
ncbi:MAG: hypothetical protein AMXMBFR46_28020 [Acidimicrobiia bacterium]